MVRTPELCFLHRKLPQQRTRHMTGKLSRLLLVWLPRSAEVLENKTFPKEWDPHWRSRDVYFGFFTVPMGCWMSLLIKHSSSSSFFALNHFPFNPNKDVSLRRIWNPQQILPESNSTQEVILSENKALA